jgi:hypothetical protein
VSREAVELEVMTVLPHDFRMTFGDAQKMCKNKVKEMHGFSIE